MNLRLIFARASSGYKFWYRFTNDESTRVLQLYDFEGVSRLTEHREQKEALMLGAE